MESKEVSEGIILNFNEEGKAIGIERLFLSQCSPDTLQKIMLEA